VEFTDVVRYAVLKGLSISLLRECDLNSAIVWLVNREHSSIAVERPWRAWAHNKAHVLVCDHGRTSVVASYFSINLLRSRKHDHGRGLLAKVGMDIPNPPIEGAGASGAADTYYTFVGLIFRFGGEPKPLVQMFGWTKIEPKTY